MILINYIEIANFLIDRMSDLPGGIENLIHIMRTSVNRNKDKEKKSEEYYRSLNDAFENNINLFKAIYFYAYHLRIEDGVDKETFEEINRFVKSGILL